MATLSIVIPCFNEESNVARIGAELDSALGSVRAFGRVEVVFVDDGSSDDTWAHLLLLAQGGLTGAEVCLVRHGRNLGLGAALRSGFAACRGEVIVTADSDLTYRLSEIPNLLARLAPGVALVTASPYHPEGGVAGVPWYRLSLSRGASFLYRLLVDRRVCTYTALFRAYRSTVVRHVPFGSDGFLAVAELLVNALQAGHRVVEYPTILHGRAAGRSNTRLLRTTAAHVRFLSGVLARRVGAERLGGRVATPGQHIRAAQRP
jgi:dolichol-phosphate mannosyltransferase